jgi:hypothetical protein
VFIRALSLSAIIVIASGCGMFPFLSSADLAQPVELDQAAPTSTQGSEARRTVRLNAEHQGNRLLFQIDNYYAEDGLLVAPESFAVGAHAQEVHYSRDEDVVTRFSARVIPYGSSMAGEMVILPVSSLEDYRLIFFSTETEPRMWDCEIVPRDVPDSDSTRVEAQIPAVP